MKTNSTWSKPKTSTQHTSLTGIIKRHSDGFGFFIPDDTGHPDIYIPRHNMKGVMTNDRVEAIVEHQESDTRLSGRILKVIRRNTQQIVGRIQKTGMQSGIIADTEGRWGRDLVIPNGKHLGAQEGDLVVVNIESYFSDGSDFTGRVIEVLGKAGDPLTDTKRVIISHAIPTQFSPETLKEISSLTPEVHPDEYKNRKDLQHLPFVTIDGVTAKDFDDAICVQSTAQGFRCWVAIADVSHYVRPDTSLDGDAQLRGNSTYFPHFVVPMLPEILSNELCSLRPHIPRLAFVADMLIDYQGEVTQSEFYEAVIKSHHRITYGEAQEVIDGIRIEKFQDVQDMILKASGLAKILMNKRFKEGSLELEIPETQIILNDAGIPLDIIKSARLFAHRLIEELMLIANVSVAKFLASHEIPAIFRVHAEPAAENLVLLQRYIETFGGKTKNLTGRKLQKKITSALQNFEGKPEAQVLNILTLRAMKQAEYSADNIGHFGLGFDYYTHFTSPIRRYADLIVHRLVKSLIMKSDQYRQLSYDELATLGTNISACEQRSVKAERQFQAIKKARFMHQYLGQEFDGVISSVTKFGVFVLLRAFDVDGLVRLDALGNDHYEFDSEHLMLVGKRTKTMFRIGDIVRVQVVNTDPEAGQIDFILVKENTNQKEEYFDLEEGESSDDLIDRFFSKEKGRPSLRSSHYSPSTDKNAQEDRREKGKRLEDYLNRNSDRKNSSKRGKTSRDSKRVRKARVSKRSRKR